ncbi:MoaD/ThiS family protein [Propionivibrio dicarboxylicus]|uniref:Molybdopterin synthase sulfur carrier subunit n=1 Tax=Propionivibrio dicarboxylicus TaxID=83767 RepID=A0A1G8D8Y8_9RHOO|nr:MoaD/ThiS family protein [Propionivibrio dicarboxylicus]SDH53750.1 molybdopterin synthase sulfur carrier subunit [Propionivibrio dicarboxylicus]
MITLLFFGPVADSVGQRRIEIEFSSGLRLGILRQQFAQDYPEAVRWVSFVAVNGVQARDDDIQIVDGSEIAFMAKFSGG